MNDLLAAYAAGWFPMAEGPDRALGLFRARKRALIPLDQRFHVPRSLRRQLDESATRSQNAETSQELRKSVCSGISRRYAGPRTPAHLPRRVPPGNRAAGEGQANDSHTRRRVPAIQGMVNVCTSDQNIFIRTACVGFTLKQIQPVLVTAEDVHTISLAPAKQKNIRK